MIAKKLLTRLLVTVPLLLLLSVLAAGQTQTIVANGVIVDEEGLPVIGAAVYLPETPSVGTSTDEKGRFSLKVAKDAVL